MAPSKDMVRSARLPVTDDGPGGHEPLPDPRREPVARGAWSKLEEGALAFLRSARQAALEVGTGPTGQGFLVELVQATAALAQVVTTGEQQRSARLQALVAQQSNQLRQATHELRRPVGLMHGHLSLLTDGSCGTVPDQLRPTLHTMQAAVTQMQELLTLLADAARLEDRGPALRREPTSLARLVAAASQTVAPEARTKQVQVEFDGPPPSLTVPVDPRQLQVALVNLLANAVKFTRQGSRVLVRVQVSDEAVTITVCDEGPGIAPQDRERIFERWQRASTAAPGLGLGLSIVRDIVALHGGELRVESQMGRGATFVMRLPR